MILDYVADALKHNDSSQGTCSIEFVSASAAGVFSVAKGCTLFIRSLVTVAIRESRAVFLNKNTPYLGNVSNMHHKYHKI